MEKETEVKSYKVIMICDRCKQGEMVPTGMMLTSFPGMYDHKCNCCGYRATYKVQYPTIVYKEKSRKPKEEK